MKRILWIIIPFIFINNSTNAGLTPSLTITATTKNVIPDGVVNTDGSEPWSATWIPMNSSVSSNTTSGMKGKFQMVYNYSYLWLAVGVDNDIDIDTSSIDIPLVTETDGVDVYLKMDTDSGNGRLQEGDYHFRMERAKQYPEGFNDFTFNGELEKDSSFTVGQTDSGTGYQQEWQFPWKLLVNGLKDSGQFNSMYLKFGIEVTDNTTGKARGVTQQVFWKNASINFANNTKLWSLILIGFCNVCYPQPDTTGIVIKNFVKTNCLIGPSPVKDLLNIKTSNNRSSNQVLIYDLNGVLEMNINIVNGEGKIDVSQLSQGIYIVKLVNENSKVYKIIKE